MTLILERKIPHVIENTIVMQHNTTILQFIVTFVGGFGCFTSLVVLGHFEWVLDGFGLFHILVITQSLDSK